MSRNQRCLRVVGVALVGFAAVTATMPAVAQQETSVSSGCVLNHDLYTCDRGKFLEVLGAAKTAAIETGPTDAAAQGELKKLVAQMGKTLVERDQHPDVTLLLVPIDPAGVQFNSGETRLATLRVFAAVPQKAGRGDLVWAENFTGATDLPWFAVVKRLGAQFRTHFNLKG